MSSPRGKSGASNVASVFTKPVHDKTLTHERLAEEVEEFRKAGGHVEVLGTTPLRRKGETPVTPSLERAPAPQASTRSARTKAR
ncbi:hypothetical protein [Lysobacter olei]